MEKLNKSMKSWLDEKARSPKKINFNMLIKAFIVEFNVSLNDARMHVMQWAHARK